MGATERIWADNQLRLQEPNPDPKRLRAEVYVATLQDTILTAVTRVVTNPAGDLLIGTVQAGGGVWFDPDTYNQIGQLSMQLNIIAGAPPDYIAYMRFSPDGQFLVAQTAMGTQVWAVVP